jgi:hypothetical protein
MIVIDNLQTKCYLQKSKKKFEHYFNNNDPLIIIYVIIRFFTSTEIKLNVQNRLNRQLSNYTINYISIYQTEFKNCYLFNEFVCKLGFFFGMSGPD